MVEFYGVFIEYHEGYPQLRGILFEEDLTRENLMLLTRSNKYFIKKMDMEALHKNGLGLLTLIKKGLYE